MIDWDAPPLRRYTVDVPAAGASPSIRWGDDDPSLYGWILSWRTEQTINGAHVNGIVSVRDNWYKGATLEYGDDNCAPMFCGGGQVFVPYGSVSIQFYDQNGVGAQIEILGRPVHCNQNPPTKTYLLGAIGTGALGTGATSYISVAPHSTQYWAILSRGDATPVEVQLQAGNSFGDRWAWFMLDSNSFASGTGTDPAWLPTPCYDKTTANGRLKITNEDGANTTSVQVYFKFDFAQGR